MKGQNIGLMFAALLSVSANAGPVRVSFGVEAGLPEGQGYVFGHDGDCALVLPAHVWRVGAGRPPLLDGPAMQGSSSLSGEATNMRALPGTSDGFGSDLAVGDVIGELASSTYCLRSRLGRRYLNVARLRRGFLQTITAHGVRQTNPLVIRESASAIELVAVTPDGGWAVQEGMSGGLVEDESGAPIGLLVAGEGAAGGLVLRMDIIKNRAEDALSTRNSKTKTADKKTALRIVSWRGESADAAHGPNATISEQPDSFWRVRPREGERAATIVLEVVHPRSENNLIKSVTIGAIPVESSAASPERIFLSFSANSPDSFFPGPRCGRDQTKGAFHCAFAATSGRFVKIDIAPRAGAEWTGVGNISIKSQIRSMQ